MKNHPLPLRGLQPMCYNGRGRGHFDAETMLAGAAGAVAICGDYAGLGAAIRCIPVGAVVDMAGRVRRAMSGERCQRSASAERERADRHDSQAAADSVLSSLVVSGADPVHFRAACDFDGAADERTPPLSTSAYTLRGVYLAWRGKTLSTVWAMILAVSQCIFVLDVPVSIALFIYEKRRPC